MLTVMFKQKKNSVVHLKNKGHNLYDLFGNLVDLPDLVDLSEHVVLIFASIGHFIKFGSFSSYFS